MNELPDVPLYAYPMDNTIVVIIKTGLPSPAANAMVWINDCHITEWYHRKGHKWELNGSTYTVTIDKNLVRIEPGKADIKVSVWLTDTDQTGVWYDSSVDNAGPPVTEEPLFEWSDQVVSNDMTISMINASSFEIEEMKCWEEFKAAGLTHIQLQCYVNPAFNNTVHNFTDWRAWFEYEVISRFDLAKNKGMPVIALGDNILARGIDNDPNNTTAYEWLMNTPWGKDTMRHTISFLRYYGVKYIKMTDEIGPLSLYPRSWYILC